ncbi:MAG TPA: thiamine-phosphate kinase [Spirochaetota bacterium]|nr:thiamine-phosphate kinase [Spirochaetota bacterium]
MEGVRLSKDAALVKAIGDDCAVVRIPGGKCALLTTDISIEGVHFTREFSPPGDIGWKAMTGNVSDVAAMGGWGRYALVSLGVPADEDEEYVLKVYDGMIEAAAAADVAIAGGDVSRSDRLVISIALYGEAEETQVVYRSGARPGNHLYVTGRLGGSKAGLELLRDMGLSRAGREGLIARHRRPVARHDIVRDLLIQFSPTAMIDISDGLLSDLRHICEASSAGFLLRAERIPLEPGLALFAKERGAGALEYALSSGEEYELLFTSEKWLADTMHLAINDIPVTLIGEITERGFFVEDASGRKEITVKGYDHFKA